MDKVSVVIPTRNHAAYVREAVDSVLNQTHPSVEVIVVDDGSTDGTREVLAPYVENGSIRYQRLDKSGICVARNTGLRVATGRLVKFLDSDDFLLPDQIARQVEQIGSSDTVVSITDSIVMRPDGAIIRRHPLVDLPERQLAAAIGANVTVIHAFLVPKVLLDRVGGFDETLTACEDWDLWIRVIKGGGVIKRVPVVGCCYRILSTSTSANTANMFHQKCSVLAKVDTWLLQEPTIPAHLLEAALVSHLKTVDEGFARRASPEGALAAVLRSTGKLLRRQGRRSVRVMVAALGIKRALQLRYAIKARDAGYAYSLVHEGNVRRYGAPTSPPGRTVKGSPHWRSTRRRLGLVLMYHRIADVAHNGKGLAVSPGHFEEQMSVLAKFGQPVSLTDLARGRARRAAGGHQIAVTFDDGYTDNFRHARPALERHGVPATFFVVSGAVSSVEAFWWDELEHALAVALPAEFHLELAGRSYRWPITTRHWNSTFRSVPENGTELSASELRGVLLQILITLPLATKRECTRRIAAWSGHTFVPSPDDLPMSAADVASLAQSPLFTIGAHTRTHPMLSRLTADEQADEIRRSRLELETIVGRPVETFAYPHGDHTDVTVRAAKQAGVEIACTTRKQVVTGSTASLRVPRFKVLDWTADEFGQQLEGWWEVHGDRDL